jgi:hypothetical protein
MSAKNKFSNVFETDEDWRNNPLIFIDEEKKYKNELNVIWESPLMQK